MLILFKQYIRSQTDSQFIKLYDGFCQSLSIKKKIIFTDASDILLLDIATFHTMNLNLIHDVGFVLMDSLSDLEIFKTLETKHKAILISDHKLSTDYQFVKTIKPDQNYMIMLEKLKGLCYE